MADASFAVTGFLGGEISQYAQGGFDKPSYKISLNVLLNALPSEIGAWTRRPGTAFAGATRGGNPGRVIKWDFEESIPYTTEWTNGYVRFRQGATLVSNNDAQAVSAISTANPAVAAVATAWASGSTIMFSGLGTSCPLLQNRQFTVTHIDGTHVSLQDAITGANIDGSTLGVGSLAATAQAYSIQTLATPYPTGQWASLRMVQAETNAFVLQGTSAPQVLSAETLPVGTVPATFSIEAASFDDGPYLDPFTNGVMATPNQATGIVQLTLSFPAYVSTTSYAVGQFATSSSVNYESIKDQNVGNTPSSSPTYWTPVSASAAINNGAGFLTTDVGRSVRLFSEPASWVAGTTYAQGNVVSYNPTEIPGAATYWQSLVSSNTGNIPGSDLTNWELVAPGAALPSIGSFTNPAAASGPAQWTYGKITSLLNLIPANPSSIARVGTMTGNGGLAAAFDGNTAQNGASSAVLTVSNYITTATPLGAFVGQNFSGCSPADYKVQSATLWPSSDDGFLKIFNSPGASRIAAGSITAYLYGSNSAPSAYNNGTLLGSAFIGSFAAFANTTAIVNSAAVNIVSSDQSTTYAYVWAAIVASFEFSTEVDISFLAAQVEFVNAAGAGSSASGVNVELLGPPLLYTTPVVTWQLGAYSNTTGWPTCGCYSDGRLWLAGAIANRFDACCSNGISGDTVNFAPTDQYGNVTSANAISYTLNSDGVNPIFWMEPDQQGILIGTQAQQWLLFPPGEGGLAPNNIDSRKVPGPGAANVLIRRTEHTYIYVQRYTVKLMEYFPDIFSGKFTAPNLADKAQHITRAGIAEIAYTYGATPVIWGRDNDGNLFGCTYKRDTLMTSQGPTYYAWHRHALGSGRVVTSIDAGPSVDGTLDALTMVTNATNTSDPQTGVYHVEIMTDAMDELTPAADAWFLDDAVTPSSTVNSATPQTGAPYGGLTLNGLWHLNGESVAVFAGGLDCGNYVVASGSVFVPYGDGVSAGTGAGLFTAVFAASGIQIVVGFDYNSDGQLVRAMMPQEAGTRNGPALGKKRRVKQIGAMLNNVTANVTGGSQLGISFGRSFAKLLPAIINFTSTGGDVGRIAPGQTFSGVFVDTIADEASFNGMVCWRINRGLSGAVAALEPFLNSEDK